MEIAADKREEVGAAAAVTNIAIAPGAIVTVPRASGSQLWVVVGRADDDIRWRLRSKRIDYPGRTDSTRRVSGSGDIVVVRAAPTFEHAQIIEHDGKFHEVVADNGDSVEVIAPASSRPLVDGRSALRYEAGHHIIVDKGELTLNLFIADYEKKARAR